MKLSTEIQENLFRQAKDFLLKNTFIVSNEKEFTEKIAKGGYLICFWCGNEQCEENLKQKTKATIRCIPFKSPVDQTQEEGYCIVCNKQAKQKVIFAKAY